MKKFNFKIFAMFIISFFICLTNVNAQDLKLTTVVQHNTVSLTNWYTIDPNSYYNESAANGLQGFSYGLDIGIEYSICNKIGIEGSISYIPTKIHGGTHYTSREVFSEPTGYITFIPLKIIANYYIIRHKKYDISVGPIIGIGFIGELDLYPSIGKARHFNGKNDFLYGAQACFNYKFAESKWSLLLSLRYLNTSYEVSEIETGDLRMDLPMSPICLHLGVNYSFL